MLPLLKRNYKIEVLTADAAADLLSERQGQSEDGFSLSKLDLDDETLDLLYMMLDFEEGDGFIVLFDFGPDELLACMFPSEADPTSAYTVDEVALIGSNFRHIQALPAR